MGKKNKGNKLSKMSEEERARYLQLRADIEEEARRRKIHLIALYMKNKLKREEAFCRLNMAKINQEWRYILRQVKCQELRNDLLDVEKYCEQLLHHKDQVIKRLLNDLDVAQDMHDTLFQSHLETLQNFKDIQQQRMDFFQENYEEQKTHLLNNYQEDYQDWKKLSDRSQEQLESIYYQLDEKTKHQQTQAHERYLNKLDDLQAGFQIKIEKISEKGEEKLQLLWSEYQQTLANYLKHTESFYGDYVDLKEQDDEYTKQTRDFCYEIERLSNQLANLKLLVSEGEDKSDSHVQHLKDLREYLNEKFTKLRTSGDRELQDGKEKFKIMCVASYNAVKNLKMHYEKCKTIAQLECVCRKFETERERLVPFGLPPLGKKTFLPNNEDDLQQVPENIEKYSTCHWLLMEQFWRRVNNVKIDLISLQQQKKSLEAENQHYKAELQERLITLNISQGRNIHINDYLAKRPNSMHVDRVEQFKGLESQPSAKCRSAQPGLESVAKQRHRYACIVEANFTNLVRSQQMKNKCHKIKLAKMN